MHDFMEENGQVMAHGPLNMYSYINEVRSDGLTPLGVAVAENSIVMAKLLVDNGADINFVDPVTNRSPLAEAIKMNNTEMVNYLFNLPQLDLRYKNYIKP